MKGMALEVVVKWIILSVVAIVVIGMIIYFSDEIKKYVGGLLKPKEEPKTEMIESGSFSTSAVITYVKSCWDKTGVNFEGDTICYILKGDVSGVDTELLNNSLDPPAQVDISKFNPSENTTFIEFEDIGNIIHVGS